MATDIGNKSASAGTAIGLTHTEPADDGPKEIIGKSGTKYKIGTDAVPITEGEVLSVPEFYGSQIQAFADSNDLTLVFARTVPALLGPVVGGTKLPVVSVHLSPATAKDLYLLVGGLIEAHEKEWGPIETAFTRKSAGKEAK